MEQPAVLAGHLGGVEGLVGFVDKILQLAAVAGKESGTDAAPDGQLLAVNDIR